MKRTSSSGTSSLRGLAFDAVLFDVGNTLLYPYPSVPEVVREILADAGHFHDLTAIDEVMPLVDAFYEDRYRADDTFWTSEEETSEVWVGMYSLLCRQLGIDEDAETIAMRVYDVFGDPRRWRPYDDVVPCLVRLREAGMRTAVVSNWDRRLCGLLEGLGVSDLLDTVVSSAEVGLHKPDPRIFELACSRIGAAPSRAAHVGDHYYADYVGALAAGLRPVLIDRHGAGCEAPTVDPITTLDQLEAALRA
jgi:putative hydrolase of the HAD superfamily